MREWFERCIARVEREMPPSARRDQSLAILRESLERYQERPVLRVIEGGRP